MDGKNENHDRSRDAARDHPLEPDHPETGQALRPCPGPHRTELRPQPERHLFRGIESPQA